MISQGELKKVIRYNPDTGEFYRFQKDGGLKVVKMKPAPDGYCRIFIKGKAMKAHRLAFIYMTGLAPEEVDHINHVRDDNRWCNLRAACKQVNLKNQSRYQTNKSGVTGVYFDKAKQKWVASIGHLGKSIFLGAFADIDLAIMERWEAEIEYGFHANHGRV